MDVSDCEDNDIGNKEFIKPHERSHLYLSNAEVQISSGRILIWQKSKVLIMDFIVRHFLSQWPTMSIILSSVF